MKGNHCRTACGLPYSGPGLQVFVPSAAAPPGVAQIDATLAGQVMLLNDPAPQICSKRNRYGARESL